jgi:hypothetical protein
VGLTCQTPRAAPGRCRGLKPLSGQRAARPDSSPRPHHPPPGRLARAAVAPTALLARAARLPTASRVPPSRPLRSKATDARVCRRLMPLAARPSLSRRVAVSAPVSRRIPCAATVPRTACRAAPPPRARAVRRALRGPAELGRASAAHAGCAPHGRATLCIWAEHGFGPKALKLNFIIF